MPVLTIVTVCRNAEATIATTLESVALQRAVGEGRVEHWVIDGASTDNTLEIVKRFPHVKSISEKDNGISDAFNKGVARAKGDWIQILNGDDALASPYILDQILPCLDPAFDFFYGRLRIMDEKLEHTLRTVGDVEGWMHLAWRMTVPHPAFFAHRRMFEKYGLFDPQFHIAMDYEWLLRSYGKAKFGFLPDTITLFRSGGVSTRDIGLRQALECLRAKEKNGVGSPLARNAWFAYQWLRASLDARMAEDSLFRSAYIRLTDFFRKNY